MIGGLLGIGVSLLGLARKADDSKTVQKIAEGIDHLNLSDEEKVKYVIDQQKNLAGDENSIRSVTRRILAVGIVGTFLSFLWLAVIFWKWNKAFSDYLLEILKLPVVVNSVTAVVIFYFGYYGITKIAEKLKK